MTLFESFYRTIGWWIINIDILLVLILLMGVIGLMFKYKVKRWGKRFLTIACTGLLFFGIVPVGLWMIEDLENRFPPYTSIPTDAKGLILLGGTFDIMTSQSRDEIAYNLTAGKLIRFAELAHEHPYLPLAFTGTPFEAEKTLEVLKNLGVNPARVLYDKSAKNTIGNAIGAAELLKPKPDEKWVLITSAYHMPRSVGLFRKAGFNVIPFPVDYHTPGEYEMAYFLGLKMNFDGWHAASREWLGLLINYLLGRSEVLYPAPQ